MKRSEMLEYIEEALFDILDNNVVKIEVNGRKVLAYTGNPEEIILKKLEERGMLPPKSEPTYHESTGKQLLTTNTWDKE